MREVGRRNGSASKGRVLSDAARLTFSLVRLGNERFANAARANLAAISAEARARATAKTRVLLSGRPRHDRRALTFEQAEQVRALKASGLTYDQLVERFGLDRATLHQIVSGKTYQRP
jgi:DNA invertase Pin-like site-specific DNA recombinase